MDSFPPLAGASFESSYVGVISAAFPLSSQNSAEMNLNYPLFPPACDKGDVCIKQGQLKEWASDASKVSTKLGGRGLYLEP